MRVFILLCALAVAFAKECGENQHKEDCPTACPLTCKNYKDPPKVCILMCGDECQCDEGFVLTDDGRCVKPEECPAAADPGEQQCGENERFTGCGTDCPLTCENYKNPPKFCDMMCRIGCECENGFVKRNDGKCVRPENCPASYKQKQCGENEHFNECGTDCPLTCENYKNSPLVCNFMCKIGCECNDGYVRRNDGKCVRPENCPASYTKGTAVGDCALPAETGPCRGYFPRFYYDSETNECHQFVYGGCQGNKNNFETKEECRQLCRVQASVDLCSLKQEVGPCRAYIKRYFYNTETKKCEEFIYGGCKGNANNFETLEACHANCA